MVSTGTEATMTAVRLARGFTGRNLIIKFAGCYHGHLDGLLAAAGSGVATLALPGSAGVTAATAAETLVLPYNDLDAVEAAFAAHGANIAAVITEAAPANMGVVTPGEGFNAGLSRITREHGALLILDEVLTGFRTGYSGYWGLTGGAAGAAEPVDPGPADLRQGHRRRHADGGPRRPCGRHGLPAPRWARSTRPAPSPGTRWPWPPASPP